MALQTTFHLIICSSSSVKQSGWEKTWRWENKRSRREERNVRNTGRDCESRQRKVSPQMGCDVRLLPPGGFSTGHQASRHRGGARAVAADPTRRCWSHLPVPLLHVTHYKVVTLPLVSPPFICAPFLSFTDCLLVWASACLIHFLPTQTRGRIKSGSALCLRMLGLCTALSLAPLAWHRPAR